MSVAWRAVIGEGIQTGVARQVTAALWPRDSTAGQIADQVSAERGYGPEAIF